MIIITIIILIALVFGPLTFLELLSFLLPAQLSINNYKYLKQATDKLVKSYTINFW